MAMTKRMAVGGDGYGDGDGNSCPDQAMPDQTRPDQTRIETSALANQQAPT